MSEWENKKWGRSGMVMCEVCSGLDAMRELLCVDAICKRIIFLEGWEVGLEY